MSYDEHLISMAGGDGELDLDAIEAITAEAVEAAATAAESTHENWGGWLDVARAAIEAAHPALLAHIRDQQAKLDRVEAQSARWATLSDGHAYYAKRIRHAIKGPPRTRAAITATEEGK